MKNRSFPAYMAFIALLSLVLILPGCGGGGDESSFSGQPALTPAQALNAPVTQRGDDVQIGDDVRPSLSDLSSAGQHGGVAISTGRVRDGESSERVKDFLTRQATGSSSWDPGTPYISTFEQKPTIQIRETTSDRYVDDVIRVVQLINAALPYDKRISVSPERAVHPSGNEEDYQSHYIPAGHIYVGLGSQNTWPPEERPPVTVAGVEYSIGGPSGGPASYIWINTNIVRRGNQARAVLAHEIFHALGFYAHIQGYRTVMNTGNYVGFPITYLPQIDTDALYALYTRFTHEYGFRPFDANDLGPWTDTFVSLARGHRRRVVRRIVEERSDSAMGARA